MKPDPTQRDNLVNQLITARGSVSRARVARMARVSEALVQRVEEGTRTPPLRLLEAYALIGGLNTDEVVLAWDKSPSGILEKLKQRPDLCAFIRAA